MPKKKSSPPAPNGAGQTEGSCGCRPMTPEETLLDRGHWSPKNNDVGIKYCPTHSAAPDLLAALEHALNSLKWAANVIRDIPNNSEYMDTMRDAQAAIRKATGGKP